jgi:hypothetical protein
MDEIMPQSLFSPAPLGSGPFLSGTRGGCLYAAFSAAISMKCGMLSPMCTDLWTPCHHENPVYWAVAEQKKSFLIFLDLLTRRLLLDTFSQTLPDPWEMGWYWLTPSKPKGGTTMYMAFYLATLLTTLISSCSTRLAYALADLFVAALGPTNGHMTECLERINPKYTSRNYYNMIHRESINIVDVAKASVKNFAIAIKDLLQENLIILVVDDTIVPRSSLKAPNVMEVTDHATRKNRPKKLWAQTYVTVIAILEGKEGTYSFPINFALVDEGSDENKNEIAVTLVGNAMDWIREEIPDAEFAVTADAWYMNGTLGKKILEKEGAYLVGHTKINTKILKHYAGPKNTRGRPKIVDGDLKLDELIETSELQRLQLPLKIHKTGKHGDLIEVYKLVTFEFISTIGHVRYLNGKLCRIVYSRIVHADGTFEDFKIFISTNPNMSGEQVLRIYHKRWATEVFYYEMKNTFRTLRDAWQQKPEYLYTWLTIAFASYGIDAIMAASFPDELRAMIKPDWRQRLRVTPGDMARLAEWNFHGDTPALYWDKKSKKFVLTRLNGRSSEIKERRQPCKHAAA